MKNYTEIPIKKQDLIIKSKTKNDTLKKTVTIILLIGFVLRLVLALLAYHRDVKHHIAWGKEAYQSGFSGLYEVDFGKNHLANLNYPPVTVYFFKLLYQAYDELPIIKTVEHFVISLPVNNQIFRVRDNFIFLAMLFKLPAIVSDIGIAYMVFLFVKGRDNTKNSILSIISLIFILFNPAFIYNSSYWGQVDSLPIFFILISLYLILFSKNLFLSQLSLLIAVLSKQTVFIFVPLLYIIYFKKAKWSKIIFNTVFMFILFILIFFPFYSSSSPYYYAFTIYWGKILTAFGTNYLTANAFNLWAFFTGFNFTPDTNLQIFGLSLRFISYFIVFILLCILFVKLFKEKLDNKLIFQVACLTPFTLFLFATRMHERHFILTLPFILLLSGYNKKYLTIFTVLNLFHFLNLYYKFFSPTSDLLTSLLSSELFLRILIILVMGIYIKLFIDYLNIQWKDILI
jgi:Gpi18-like mannosyltransferase